MEQLLCHLFGDYVLQSHWMATNKRHKLVAVAVHAFCYSLPFMLLTFSPSALAVICGSHLLIDHFGLARYVVWAKNWLAPWSRSLWEQRMSWKACEGTGFVPETRGGPPPWLATWLLIIVDNTLHLTINYLALRFL